LAQRGKRRARQIALTPSTGTLLPAPGESVDWDTTRNLIIEGDNLEVLKLLQKSYAGKVSIIYVDPPYNTGGDFIYPDDFRDGVSNYLHLTGQLEGGRKISSNTEASGRFHTDWLNMIYPRLKLARTLLDESGLIFVSCDDNEASNLRSIMNEILGEENMVAQIIWKKSYGGGAKTKHVVVHHEYILCYAKNKDAIGRLELPADPAARRYYKMKDAKFEKRGPYRLQPLATTSNDERENLRYPIPYNGLEIWPEKQWQWEKTRTFAALAEDNLVIAKNNGEWSVSYKQYLYDEDGVERGAKPASVLDGPYTQRGTAEFVELMSDQKLFPFPKPTDLIRGLIQYAHPKSEFIVLDFFAGSGSTAHAVLRQNAEDGGKRRYIMVQLPEPTGREDFQDIAEITKERIRRASKAVKDANAMFTGDTGFRVFKLATSNIRAWTPDGANLDESLLKNAEHLIQGRKEQDVLYELLLKLGLDLCTPIQTKAIAGKTVYCIGEGALIACLSDGIVKEIVEPLSAGIASWIKELSPAVDTRVVFKDSAFADDIAKTNMAAILTQNGISDVRSL
jgi:adenine-specific DNA-methyltransferase